MELVRGIKITEYCDQHKLPIRERLELFIKVCQAIQHAHEKGIIHRDLKPSNILVTLHDSVPVPKVIDFGIAKATEGRLTDLTVYTQLHQLIGTPAYMSPEQAEMSAIEIDTRSDIYSLGVLLYELLIGKTPFDAKELVQVGLDEMRHTIREQEPVRPSTRLSTMPEADSTMLARRRQAELPKIIRSIRGDLDWITLKCLEKDRTRRYETASSLAADLHRHLNNQPVFAGPPRVLERCQRFFRRHELAWERLLLASALIGLALGAAWWIGEKKYKPAENSLKPEAGLATSHSTVTSPGAFQSLTSALQTWVHDPAKHETDILAEINSRMRARKFDEVEEIFRVLLTPDVLAHPDASTANWLAYRGDFFARRGRFKEADADFRKAITAHEGRVPLDYLRLASLLVQMGDLEGYRTVCVKLLTAFENNRDSWLKDALLSGGAAKACLIIPVVVLFKSARAVHPISL